MLIRVGRQRTLGSVLALTAALAGVGSARAAEAENEATTLNELIVTAQKREQSVQDVPAAVTALGSEQIEQRGVQRVADLVFQAPGLQVGEIYGLAQVFVRGVGLNEPSGSTAPGVAVYIDGVYQPHPAQAALATADLQRIEFVRGPQGTLYGRNATGGAINFLTAAPSAEAEGELKAGFGSYQTFRSDGVLNLPAGERVRARLAFAYENQAKGHVDNIGAGPDLGARRLLAGRFKTAVDLAPSVHAEFTAYALEAEESLVDSYFGPFGAATVANNPVLATVPQALEPWTSAANSDGVLKRHVKGANVRLTGDVGAALVTAITSFQSYTYGYRNFDADQTAAVFSSGVSSQDIETFMQQVDASGAIGRLEWLAGVSFMRDDYYFDFDLTYPLGNNTTPGVAVVAPGGGIVARYRNITESRAAYVDLTLAVTEQLKLIVGGRYTEDQLRVTQSLGLRSLQLLQPTPFFIPFAAQCANAVASPKFDATTWRGGAQYSASPSLGFYGTVSRGFKGGGVNNGLCGDVFAPETVTSYEAGVKSQHLAGRLMFNAAAFYYGYENLQVFKFLPTGGSQIENARKARVWGVEFETQWRPDDHWTLNANATFLETEYRDFHNIDDLAPGLGLQDLRGNRLNYSPPYSVNLGLQYATDELAFGRVTARAEARFEGDTYFRPYNLPADAQGSYEVVNLSLIWDGPDRRQSARAFVRNLFDRAFITSLNAGSGTRHGSYGMPRLLGVEFTTRF